MSWLKRARRAKGLTANELATMLGISRNYLQRMESGSRDIPTSMLSKIQDTLGFTKDEMPFNFEELIQKCGEWIDEHGQNRKCYLTYSFIDGRIIFTGASLESNSGMELETNLACGKWLLEFQQWALD